MIPVLLLSIALAAPGPRAKRKGAKRATVNPVVPAGLGVNPDYLPALIGQRDQLQLEGLKRSTIRFTVEQDGTVLDSIDADTALGLKRQLAADPAWRLTRLHATWVATRRTLESGAWTSGPEGYHLDEDHCWRIGVRLGEAGAGYPWGEGVAIQRFPADQTLSMSWAISVEEPPCRGQRAVAVVVEGAEIALELLDSGDGEDLPIVVRGLTEVPLELANAGIDTDLIGQRGFDPSQLSAALPKAARTPAITARGGELEFHAALHFSEPGLSWVRLIRDGAPWNAAAVADATLEAPGWSSDPTDYFPLQSRIPVPSEGGFSATLELWFQPEGGSPAAVWQGPVQIGS